MKEQRMRVLSRQTNAVQHYAGGQQRMPWRRGRFGNWWCEIYSLCCRTTCSASSILSFLPTYVDGSRGCLILVSCFSLLLSNIQISICSFKLFIWECDNSVVFFRFIWTRDMYNGFLTCYWFLELFPLCTEISVNTLMVFVGNEITIRETSFSSTWGHLRT